VKAARAAIVGLLLTVVVLVPTVMGQASAHFDLSWHVIAGGGARSTSSSFMVNGSIGQPAVGRLSSANYVLGGGFWPGIGPVGAPVPGPYKLYLPIVLKIHS